MSMRTGIREVSVISLHSMHRKLFLPGPRAQAEMHGTQQLASRLRRTLRLPMPPWIFPLRQQVSRMRRKLLLYAWNKNTLSYAQQFSEDEQHGTKLHLRQRLR